MLDEIVQDVRFGFRVLIKNPGFSGIAILVLALGIGVNCAIFSFVNAMLFRPLPVPSPSQLVGVYDRNTEPPGDYRPFSYPNYRDLREQATGFTELAAYGPLFVGIEKDGVSRRAMAFTVSDNYFRTFGAALREGREFVPAEAEPGADIPVVIVSHDYWDREGNDPELVGATLRINGRPFTVIGIAREGFTGTSAFLGPDLWMPLGIFHTTVNDLFAGEGGTDLTLRDRGMLMLVGRVRPGVDTATVDSELGTIAARLADSFPDANAHHTFASAPLSRVSVSTEPQTDRDVRALAALLTFMASVVLMIGCLNLANMLLARGGARQQEIAVRQSLGGGRHRIVRQLLTEGLLLSIAGSIIGLVVAHWAVNLLLASIEPVLPFSITLPRTEVDARVLAATVGFSVLATLFFGLGPAWKLARRNLVTDLKQQVPGESMGHRLLGGRNVLIVGQVALSLALLTAGGLFLRGALRAAARDPGFRLEQGILVEVDPSLVGYDESRGRRVYAELLDRLATLPGVEVAAAASLVPFSGVSEGKTVEPVGATEGDEASRPSARYSIITPRYFEAVGLPILQGRDFTPGEITSEGSPHVVIIDQPLADLLWPGGEALGQFLRLSERRAAGPGEPMQVVGIVPGLRQEVFDAEPVPHVYVPFGDPYRAGMTIHLKTSARGASAEAVLLGSVREEIRRVDAQLPVFALKTLEDHRDGSVELWIIRAGSKLFTTFGVVALFMAVVGIYGVKAYAVSRRTREVGIRLALGATTGDVQWLFLREGLAVTATGLAMGFGLAVLLSKALESFLVEVSALDPLVFAVAPSVLAAAAMLASYLPARRVSRVEPVRALRYE